MNLKPLNATVLADVLADMLPGQGHKATSQCFLSEIEADPCLPGIYWFLVAISRRPGALDELVNAVAPRDTWARQQLIETLSFLADEPCNFDRAGKCPSEIRTAIIKQMQQHAQSVRATLADTKVSLTILKELDLATKHKVPLPIIGDSRFGKTKAVSVWCDMHPGQKLLVTVPESNREWDFFAAHADAAGIAYNDRTPAPRLKRMVEWVLQQGQFFICYDEAHFLVPTNYHKDTPPKRINWVRCQVIDKGIGCAFLATPQSLDQTLDRYAARTKYNFEQWLGRLAPPIVLADYYDRDELMAVANVHFPDFPERLLALICARAMQSEGYLKSMEFTARYASALAQDRQNKTPTLQDVEKSIERMMPKKSTAPALVEKPSRNRSASPLKPALTPLSEPVLNGAGTTRQAENFTSRRPEIVADLDTDESHHADRSLVSA